MRLLLLSLLALGLWLGGDLTYVLAGAENDHAVRADTIIVLGCMAVAPGGGPSDCIEARATHAAELYKRGLSAHVIASGGGNEGRPESLELAAVLRQAGVPAVAIVQESRSQNTIQNIEYSSQIMQQNGWHSAILVTEPYHINRATLIARDAGLQVYASPAVNSPLWRDPWLRLLKVGRDTLSLLLYQLKVATGTRE